MNIDMLPSFHNIHLKVAHTSGAPCPIDCPRVPQLTGTRTGLSPNPTYLPLNVPWHDPIYHYHYYYHLHALVIIYY